MPLIASIDGPNRDIYLSADTVGASINPIDIYKEMRTLRRTDETLRRFDVFLSAFGNVPKGGGKFTERYVQCNAGTRIIPFDITHTLTITGTIITDDGQEGISCFDRTPLNISTIVDINYVPPQVEVISVNTGSGVSAQDITDITVAVWNYTTRVLTSAGAGGATAQEVWEYATRELTGAAGVTAQDISDIADAVWDETLSQHTAIGSTGEQLGNTSVNVDTGAISTAVWSNVSRTLTESAGVTTQDIADIADAVWSENIATYGINTAGYELSNIVVDGTAIATDVWAAGTRTLTSTLALEDGDISAIVDAIWDEDITTHVISNSTGANLSANLDTNNLGDIANSVWTAGTRELTGFVGLRAQDLTDIADTVWDEPLAGHVNIGSTAEQLTNTLTSIDNNAIAASVWSSGTRTLSSGADISTAALDSITAGVWSETTRTITAAPSILAGDLTNIADSVWTRVSRTLSDPLSITAFDLGAIANAVWEEPLIEHLTLGTAGEALDDASASVDPDTIATAVWTDTTRTLTATLAPSANTIAAQVWSQVTRTLTSAPAMLNSDINLISDAVWLETSRTLTSSAPPTSNAIATAVWGNVNRTLSSSSDPTASAIAAAVWAQGTRSLTDGVVLSASGLTSVQSSIWGAATRSLTNPVDLTSSTIASISTDIWSETTRTITGDVDVSATSLGDIENTIWNSAVRGLTTDVSLSTLDINAISDAVWAETTRTLTDTGLTGIESTMLKELWQVGGLDSLNPVTNTQTQTTVDTIDIQYTGNSKTAVTSTRQ